MQIDVISALVRALSFIAMFQAAGVATVIAMFGRRLEQSAQSIRNLGFVSATAGLLLVFVHYALEAARMSGTLSGVLDMSLQRLVLDSPMSMAAGLRLSGLALIACTIRRQGALSTLAGILGAVFVVVAFTFVGHTARHPEAPWLAIALILHLLIVAFWFGSLVPLHIISRVEHPQRAAHIVAAFTRVASVLAPGLFFMGFALTVLLVDRWAVFGEATACFLSEKSPHFQC